MGDWKEQRRRTMERAATNPHRVQVGEVWRDTDPRSDRVPFSVMEINGAYATVTSNGRRTRKVRLDRFKPGSTGYERLEQPFQGVEPHHA